MKKRTQKFYSGIAYQYEYSNGTTGSYRGYSTESSNMRGSSAMIELGWQVKPTEQSPWMVDVGATGWVGHQKGFTVQAKLMKSF